MPDDAATPAEREVDLLRARVAQLEGELERVTRDAAEAGARQRPATQELIESEARFRGLVENGAVGLVMGDASGRLTYVNEALLRMLGYARADVEPALGGTPLRWDVLTPPEWLPLDRAALEELQAHGHVAPYEKEFVGKDGQRVPVLTGPTVLGREADGTLELAAFVVDLTHHHEVERALRESEQRFRALADNIPQLAWMANADGTVAWFNRNWIEFTGIDVEDTRRPDWRSGVYHPAHIDRMLEGFRRAFTAGVTWEDTFPLRSRTGEYRWFLSRAVPIRDERGTIIRWVGTNTDITTQLEAEEALRAAKDEAERANRGKSEFLAAMSHDLRTPLNAIRGYAELLEIGIHGPVTAAQSAVLERVRVNGEHLLKLINDILNFAKLEAGRLTFEVQEVSVGSLVASVGPLVEPDMATRGVDYEVTVPDRGLTLRADVDRARQVLLNLIGNATKFTEPGGHIGVATWADEQLVHIRVSDTGPGIPNDRLERIFEPFVQLDRARVAQAHRGIGLGLAISRELARGMGGDVTAESTLHVGSTFTLSLPRSLAGVSARYGSGDRRRRAERRAPGAAADSPGAAADPPEGQ